MTSLIRLLMEGVMNAVRKEWKGRNRWIIDGEHTGSHLLIARVAEVSDIFLFIADCISRVSLVYLPIS